MEAPNKAELVGGGPENNMVTQALAIVEKKVRNLEKRKGKLDGYREDKRRGKELNEDQKAAVAKYDEVVGTLDFARELTGQFTKLASDDAKDRKKQAKREQQEKARQELAKVAYMLSVRELLSSLGEEGVVAELSEGKAGAPTLTADQLAQLEQLRKLVTPDREDTDRGGFEKQVSTSAEHLVGLAEHRARPVPNMEGVQYKELAELMDTIRASGYLETRWAQDKENSITTENGTSGENDEDGENTADDEDTEEEGEADTVVPEEDEEEAQQVAILSAQVFGLTVERSEQVLEQQATIKANGFHPEVDMQDPHVDPRLAAPQPLAAAPPQEVQQVPVAAPAAIQAPLPTLPPAPMLEPSFNFLQDSQIDLESPHMDPAVVMVHPPKRPPLQGGGGPPGIPSQTFSNPAFQAQMAGLTPSQQAQVIAQQQALLSNGGRPGGQQQQVPANSAAPQQHQSPQQQQQQQVLGLAQQQQGLGTAPGPQGLGAPAVGQPGLGAGQPRQPVGQTGLGTQFPNQLSGPYAGHMQTKAPAQPAPFTQQTAAATAIPSEGRDVRQDSRQQQQDPRQQQSSGDQQHPKPFAPQQSTTHQVGDGGDGRSPPQSASRPPAEPSPPQKAPGYAAAAGGVSKQPDSEIGTWKPEGASESSTWAEEGGEDSEGRGWGGRGRGRGRGNR